MNRKCREKLDACCDELVPKINLVRLWPKLLDNKIFNRDDVNIPHWTASLTDERTVRDVYLTIKTRGPLAFDRFVTSLRQTGHDAVANKLEGKKSMLNNNDDIPAVTKITSPINNNEVLPNDTVAQQVEIHPVTEWEPDNFFSNLQSWNKPLEIRVRKSTVFLDNPAAEGVQRYPMRSKPRGLVLIITNIFYKSDLVENRFSAKHDMVNLNKLFTQMGYEVVSYYDLTGKALLSKVKEFAKRKDLRKVDSCFVIISSHGCINKEKECSEIEAVDYTPKVKNPDYQTVLCSDIVECFTAEACPQLAGKPKVFIFQLCRGPEMQKIVKEPRHRVETSQYYPCQSDEVSATTLAQNPISTRNYSDMLAAYATTNGHVAFRDSEVGSWYIQILCEVFMNYASTIHVQDLFNMIDERLEIQRTKAGECQTSEVKVMGFNKHCYLNPGLFEET